MKKIKLLATKPRKHPFPIVSWGIRLVEWSKFSHVGVLFPDENKVFNAHFNDIEFEDLGTYIERNKIVEHCEWEVEDEYYRKALEFVKENVGRQKGYYSTLFGALVPQLIRNMTCNLIIMKNPTEKGYTCSALFYDLIKYCGGVNALLLPHGIPRGIFTTRDALETAKRISG